MFFSSSISLIILSLSSSSNIENAFSYHNLSINILKKYTHIEWNVQSNGKSEVLYGLIFSTSLHSTFHILSFISLAALLVNVTQRIDHGAIQSSFTIYATLSVNVWVFHAQAHASINRGHSVVSTAIFWLSLSIFF